MATSFELEGTVRHILDLQTFASGFSKREFVVEVEDGKFPQMIKFECLKDKAALLDKVAVGDEVKVNFDIRGNEFKDRFFVNLAAWKITPASGEGGGGPAAAKKSADTPPSSLDDSFDNEPDDSDEIPF
jgi:hypothetical protein